MDQMFFDNHMSHGLMCLSLCGHKMWLPKKSKMTIVLVASCVATVSATYLAATLANLTCAMVARCCVNLLYMAN